MLPVTRGNLDHICCICLLDIRPSVFTQKVHDVRNDYYLSKVLKLTAHITILKNPINQKYINDYCRKVCETCFIKVQYSYTFREKIVASTTTLKELWENNLNEMYGERLNFFCRICLNLQPAIKDTKRLEIRQINSLKYCSGIRFTSFVDMEPLRIKDGTNINEIAIISDTHFPQRLCRSCFRKLRNVDEFRKFATQSFEYMISVMGDATLPEEQNKKQTESLLLNCKKYGEPHVAVFNNKVEKQQSLDTNVFQNSTYSCVVNPLINEKDFTNTQHFANAMDDNCHYSANSEEDNVSNFNESPGSIDSDNEINLRISRTKNSEQVHINEMIVQISKEYNIKRDIKIKNKNASKVKLSCRPQTRSNGRKKLKENNGVTKIDISTGTNFVCDECSKEFTSKHSLRNHKGLVHNFDMSKMLECMICFKKFKSKGHINAHIRAVHEKQKLFTCTYCSKTFAAKSTKRVHELSHTGDFPFKCNFCGKGFRRSNQLKIHLDIHTSIPELLCPICKRTQTSKTDLENHLKIHSDKRVQCPLCGKFFTRNFHLIDHQNAVHFKLRPFKCGFCELAFGDRRTRRTHEKSHTEDRPLKCSICLMGFKSKIGLTRHIKENGHNLESS